MAEMAVMNTAEVTGYCHHIRDGFGFPAVGFMHAEAGDGCQAIGEEEEDISILPHLKTNFYPVIFNVMGFLFEK
jgi:hypothetical protein